MSAIRGHQVVRGLAAQWQFASALGDRRASESGGEETDLSKKATQAVLEPETDAGKAFGSAVGDMWKAFSQLSLPGEMISQIQGDYVKEATQIWNRCVLKPEEGADHPVAHTLGDRRFAADDWVRQPMNAFLASMYLLNAKTLTGMADALQGDEKTRARVRFAVQQWVDALSPSNCLAFNPEAMRKAIESGGESIGLGMIHLWNDLQQGHVSQTDETVFEVGRNVATTEGAVVYENELFQLIEYKPLTDEVYATPMLFVPPCINKYYILDLQPQNSVIRHTVAQGHRLFVISWRNVNASLADKTWDDYIEQGPIEALKVVQAITGSRQVNTLGFCVGGTILATALAVLEARGENPASSITLLTTFLDFADTGVLDLFIDETMVQMREMTIGADAPGGPGLLKGQELATTFSFLRPNDLVWNYVVGNYLKGETPPPFDLLYWNSDSTNLPGPMFCWYLRHTYLENALKEPGKVTVCGVPLNLGAMQTPAFVYGSREDHIVPWRGAFASTAILKGPKRFVLGASGHIAGVINPPEAKKRSHWTNDAMPASADEWMAGATETKGSWWPDWMAWLAPLSGELVRAPKGYGKSPRYKVIEAAPGRYVRERA
jgi:polyhydroxyalkanoate synthase subunit PhaC